LPEGVLLPLFFREERKSGEQAPGEYVFLLNKRSKKVLQPETSALPAEEFTPSWIPLSETAAIQAPAGIGARVWNRPGRGKRSLRSNPFSPGNALRESWEELRLSPFNVEFLGLCPPTPFQPRWIIFPSWQSETLLATQAQLEVEKIVPFPIRFF